jgi:3-dehydroquinate synthase II
MKKVVLNLIGREGLLSKAVQMGFDSFILEKAGEGQKNLNIYTPEKTGYVRHGLKPGQVPRLVVKTPEDLNTVVEYARKGCDEVVIATADWKIIPTENLIAMLRGVDCAVLAEVGGVVEAELFLNILERGVDGVVVTPRSEQELALLQELVKKPSKLPLVEALVEEVRDVGVGDRACIDTVSMLELGEGLLVGSMSTMFFLIHNESIGSSFTSPRPFRVNAGAVHSYILMPNGQTRYLSELEAGTRVLIVSRTGDTRITSVGRVKIERRPMRLVRASADGVTGAVTVQNAETIRFITARGDLIPVTELKKGDRILAYLSEVRGRHFGMAVDETVVEK